MKREKRIAIVGPESTGKTTLALALGRAFKCNVAEEQARDYLNAIGRPYNQDDLRLIAEKQCREEDRLAGKMLICDTTLLVIDIWSRYRYGNTDSSIASEMNRRRYDLFLLCNIDLPWTPDPLREHPQLRRFFFNWYHKELIDSNVNYEFVTGACDTRIERAIAAIKRLP